MHLANPLTFDGLGVWIAALLTLFIFSFLYKDNPFYKLAEHLFVGISAGYYVAQEWWAVIYPQCVKPVMTWQRPIMIIPGVLGLLLFSRFVPKAGWLSRWSLAIIIGAYAGIKTTGFAQGDLVEQFHASLLPLWVPGQLGVSIDNVLFVAGLVSTLVFFFFSTEHKGAIKSTAQLGVWFLMISFGAAYGFTVMARVSLLIGRFQFLLDPWLGVARF
ncbi:MAG TPA: hypothetical protein VKF80_01220 [Candidatus Eisenbacteria bacterium]|nr:hypothetical protein [Candidatus Eisenbacteria bacterium]